ncbi:isochorismate synthase MenF [Nocardia sp. NPDC058640]|uniref:isochorismate synthase n=1 Tax=Nocardia sp. NPDC058640 TaxID=3346571 RepID=UPI003669013C
MNEFLLARPDAVVRASGVREVFSDPRRAVEALRGWLSSPPSAQGREVARGSAAGDPAGDSSESSSAPPRLIVGALPFDPREPAALWRPETSLHTAGPWRPAALPDLPDVRVIAEIPSAAEHVAKVTKLVEQLGDPANELRKVVAARSMVLEADAPLHPEVLAAHLLTRHPNAAVYSVDLFAAGRAETLIGATPEVLVARHGDRVSLHPLAGTLPRLSDPTDDAQQAGELLSSTKNHEEHAFVIDWIRQQLSPVCAELHIPDAPEILSTEQVWHLATPIHGVLRDPSTTALDLALLLHPTPAVNGTPYTAALDTITADEPWRGFYGGAVGWCDDTGDGEWVVAIRGGELSADRRTLRASAGGGIVAASDPLAELAETTAKLRTLLSALRCALPND